MLILHCCKAAAWEKARGGPFYGEAYIRQEGFIHCSDVHTFHKVAPNFTDTQEPLLLLCIDASKVGAEIRWEDDGNYGTAYPHIYGPLNLDAVVNVLPFQKDENNCFVLNPELR